MKEELKKLFLQTFPDKNDWNYANYDNGWKSVVIDGEYDLDDLIENIIKLLTPPQA